MLPTKSGCIGTLVNLLAASVLLLDLTTSNCILASPNELVIMLFHISWVGSIDYRPIIKSIRLTEDT